MKHYTIYRINLENVTASLWKQIFADDSGITNEMKRLREFTNKYNNSSVFIYREETPKNKLVIPVL